LAWALPSASCYPWSGTCPCPPSDGGTRGCAWAPPRDCPSPWRLAGLGGMTPVQKWDATPLPPRGLPPSVQQWGSAPHGSPPPPPPGGEKGGKGFGGKGFAPQAPSMDDKGGKGFGGKGFAPQAPSMGDKGGKGFAPQTPGTGDKGGKGFAPQGQWPTPAGGAQLGAGGGLGMPQDPNFCRQAPILCCIHVSLWCIKLQLSVPPRCGKSKRPNMDQCGICWQTRGKGGQGGGGGGGGKGGNIFDGDGSSTTCGCGKPKQADKKQCGICWNLIKNKGPGGGAQFDPSQKFAQRGSGGKGW
jgi:hypothetical protein